MRLLMATLRSQGHRPNDFSACKPGELVMPPVHACDDEDVDGPCGCRRSLIGLDTHQPTTTFEVIEVSLGIDELADRVRRSLGTGGLLDCVEDPEVADRWVTDIAWELMQAGARFTPGAVVERRGTTLQVRN